MEQESLAYRSGNCPGRQNHLKAISNGTPDVLARPIPSVWPLYGHGKSGLDKPGVAPPRYQERRDREQHTESLDFKVPIVPGRLDTGGFLVGRETQENLMMKDLVGPMAMSWPI